MPSFFPERAQLPNTWQAFGSALTQGAGILDEYQQKQNLLRDMVERRAQANIDAQMRASEEARQQAVFDEGQKKKANVKEFGQFATTKTPTGPVEPLIQPPENAAPYDVQPGFNGMSPFIKPREMAGPDYSALQDKAIGLGVTDDPAVREYLNDRNPLNDPDFLIKKAQAGRTTGQSYRDIAIPDQSMGAWGRSVEWYNRVRNTDPSINQLDLMERFVQEQVEDGIPKNDARKIVTQASSRINQVYGTGIKNQWDATTKAAGAGKAALEAGELGIGVPGGGSQGPKRDAVWSKDLTDRISGITSRVKQDFNYDKEIDQINNGRKVIEILNQNEITPASISAAITSLARMTSPGVVTDQDYRVLTNYGAPAGIRQWDQVAQWASGLPPDGAKAAAIGLANVLESSAQRKAGEVLNSAYESVIATGVNVDRDRLWQFIAPQSTREKVGISEPPKADTMAAKPGMKAVDRNTAADYLKRAGGDRKKAKLMLKKDGYDING